MKVIFLDVDGVLNCTPDFDIRTQGGGAPINMSKVRILEQIIDETDCEIVVSSSWRLSKELYKHLKNCLPKTPLDKTPNLPFARGDEIKAWLERNPLVERYVILDDDSDVLPEQKPHLIQTEHDYGLTKGLAYRVKYKLMNEAVTLPMHKG